MKTTNTFLLVCLINFVLNSQANAQNNTPGISLFTFSGERRIEHSTQDPLLLYINITNSAAVSTARKNARNQTIIESYSKTDKYKELSKEQLDKLSKDYPTIELPTFKLGSSSTPLIDLINIQIRNNKGENVQLDIRPLASSKSKDGIVKLEQDKSHLYIFVIESKHLATLDSGSYHFAVGVDTRKSKDMWQGWAYSNTVTVSINEQHSKADWGTSDGRAMLLSAYLLGDQQFDLAEQHARSWIERHPESVNAWSDLGDALAGLEKNDAALKAYDTGVKKFWLKNGADAPEAPRELIEKINRLDASDKLSIVSEN